MSEQRNPAASEIVQCPTRPVGLSTSKLGDWGGGVRGNGDQGELAALREEVAALKAEVARYSALIEHHLIKCPEEVEQLRAEVARLTALLERWEESGGAAPPSAP